MRYQALPDAAQIRRAHDRFLDTGRVPHGVVPDVIERSWQRCAGLGVQSDRVRELGRLDRSELGLACARHDDLLAVCEPVLDMLHEQLSGTGCVVLLCAPDGLIVRSLGDPEFVSRAEKVALKPGVSWSEDQKGTNAIGTAIAERAPVVVYAAQHYVESNHFLTCSAAPVFDAEGELTAVLDISGDYRSHQTHTLALVKMAGRHIERQLFLRRYRRECVLQIHPQSNYLGSLFDGRVAFGDDGELLAADNTARRTLGLNGTAGSGFETVFDARFLDTVVRLRGADPIVRLRGRNGGVVFAQLARGLPETSRLGGYGFVRGTPAAKPTFDTSALDSLHGGDEHMRATVARLKRILGRDIPILIEGETGTGKELLARALHSSGPRADKPFVAVNCASIPEGLIESELFGYEEGAFTGARRRGQVGKILQADGGTLFLDEIGDMPLAMQARLLRVLQEREVHALGNAAPRKVDIAVVCATHRALSNLVAEGLFREDLYYRLNGLTVRLPPLRERQDLDFLAERLLAAEVRGADAPSLSAEVREVLRCHAWPGNIRQLHSVLRTAYALHEGDGVIRVSDLPDDFRSTLPSDIAPCVLTAPSFGAGPLGEIELQAIKAAVVAQSGNLSAAAKQLGISRATLYRKLKRTDVR